MFLTTVRPYKGASSDTIARWIKNKMLEAGINTALFSPHSCRSAVTSKVDATGTSITTILQSASWSRTSTLKKFYLKDIQQVYPDQNNEDNFGRNLLYVHYEINIWLKGKYFAVLHVYNTQKRRFMF